MSLITAFVAQQLSAESQVATSYAQSAEHKATWQRVVKAAQQARTKQAEARYRLAMQDWSHTGVIEDRLGYMRTSSLAFLRKLLSEGKVERRPRDGVATYSRKAGYDWRWINGN